MRPWWNRRKDQMTKGTTWLNAVACTGTIQGRHLTNIPFTAGLVMCIEWHRTPQVTRLNVCSDLQSRLSALIANSYSPVYWMSLPFAYYPSIVIFDLVDSKYVLGLHNMQSSPCCSSGRLKEASDIPTEGEGITQFHGVVTQFHGSTGTRIVL